MHRHLMNHNELFRALFTPASVPSRRTWYRWIKQGLIPRVKIGGTNYFNLDEVASALAQRNPQAEGLPKHED